MNFPLYHVKVSIEELLLFITCPKKRSNMCIHLLFHVHVFSHPSLYQCIRLSKKMNTVCGDLFIGGLYPHSMEI